LQGEQHVAVEFLKSGTIFEYRFKELSRNVVRTILSSENHDSGDANPSQGYVVEAVKPVLKKPPRFQVVMLNDDYTPMEFVVEILESFFHMERELAVRVMLKVHTEGRAVCGVFTKDVAETKAFQVNQYASESDHPLMCEVEPADDGE